MALEGYSWTWLHLPWKHLAGMAQDRETRQGAERISTMGFGVGRAGYAPFESLAYILISRR